MTDKQIWKKTRNTKIKFGVTLTQIKRVDTDELGGWISERATLSAKCWIGVEVDFMGGEIWGGVIRGGVIWGGEIRGGEIRGGEIRGGEIRGGEIRGGAKIETSHDILECSPIGSESDVFTAYKCAVGFNITRGCFTGTPREFKAAVKKTHGRTKHGQIYMHILKLCEVKFGKSFWDEPT